jgi:hypothetical protein
VLLLPADRLEERRHAARGPLAPLAPLARSLSADLAPAMAHDLFMPSEKARLSRVGGRCPRDGTLLAFDPFAPRAHRCERCGGVFTDDAHYRWWIHWYHLWLAERAVHGALLHLLGGDAAGGRWAEVVLERYADQYLRYPNQDNVLGPTRPFFSTYLESIWLLQVCIATDLLEATGQDRALGARVRDQIVAPSARLIASYDEGTSNRQVWNNAAMFAAGQLLRNEALVEHAVWGPSGLAALAGSALLPDGTWYEGENYHLFAHRGLWYGVVMAECAGVEMPPEITRRIQAGFAAPFLTALPDETLPARRDSQFGISLRQWRFADLCELGLARHDSDVLRGALSRIYAANIARGDTGRRVSTADVERNVPASALTRADLGWRCLLHALPVLPALSDVPRQSVLLEAQGLAVLRREDANGGAYVALDYGHSGGGHGHPDRLNVLLAHGDVRWLDDPGTGSYVDPSLHWYRSTLAHNAPLVNGHSQPRIDGVLRAFDDRTGVAERVADDGHAGAFGWVDAEVFIAPRMVARRTLMVARDYVIDDLQWSDGGESGGAGVRIDIPLHVDAECDGVVWTPSTLRGGDGLEDGFSFLTLAETAAAAPATVMLRAEQAGQFLRGWCTAFGDVEWWRAVGPGPPGAPSARFLMARMRAPQGALRTVWCWTDGVARVDCAPQRTVVTRRDGATHTFERDGDAARMLITAPGGATRTIAFGGQRRTTAEGSGGYATSPRETGDVRAPAIIVPRVARHVPDDEPLPRGSAHADLGESHYRRSEQSWHEAGCPRARVTLAADADALIVDVASFVVAPRFVPAGADNDMDNEHADIHGDGVQLYVRMPGDASGDVGAWVLVPESAPPLVRVRVVAGASARETLQARWRLDALGYTVRCRIPLPPDSPATTQPGAIDVIVNETAPGRERRRGQLVLSGAEGEWVYLRGDRQPANRMLTFVLRAAGR